MKPSVNLVKRSNYLTGVFGFVSLSVLSFSFTLDTVFATTTTSIPASINVNAVVIQATISPAPPPQPSPIANNGIPLSPSLSGTDSAVFKGRAYPQSVISVLKNGLVLNELPANSDGTFEVPVHNIVPGTYTFSLLAKDKNGLKSSKVTYTIIITSGIVTEIKNIIIPPTITTDKTEVKQGDTITFSGFAAPSSWVDVSIFTQNGLITTVEASSSGAWSYTFSTTGLDLGDLTTKARFKLGSEYSLYSESVVVTIGTKNTLRKKNPIGLINARCDLNNDGRVNLLDFSIMAFWYKRLGFPQKVDLNSDGRINLTDLSILAYCWTG